MIKSIIERIYIVDKDDERFCANVPDAVFDYRHRFSPGKENIIRYVKGNKKPSRKREGFLLV